MACIRSDGLGHCIQVGQRVHRHPFVADTHVAGIEPHIFVDDLVVIGEG